jgi:TPR repeat protein
VSKLWLLLALLLVAAPRESSACTVNTDQLLHTTDPAEAARDKSPPGPVTVVKVAVERGQPDMRWSSCDSLAGVSFKVAAKDNRSSPEQLGYRIMVSRGRGPSSRGVLAHAGEGTLSIPNEPVVAVGGQLLFHWYESDIDLPPIDLTLVVTAVDNAGNESLVGTTVRVFDDGFKGALPAAHAAMSMVSAAKQCDQGDGAACAWAGKRLRHGLDVPQNNADARRRYEMACDLGVAVGCEFAALANRPEAGKLNARALRLHEAACATQDRAACRRASDMYVDGRGVPEDRNKAHQMLEAACAAGDRGACGFLRWIGRPAALTLSHRQWCNKGDLTACESLAEALDRGWNQEPRDPTAAEAMWLRLCEQANAEACHRLGLRGLATADTPASRASAATFLERACALELIGCSLATAVRGFGRPAPTARLAALRAFVRWCHAGTEEACLQLALVLERGLGGQADPSQARVFSALACHGGHEASCLRLGDEELPVDVVRAADFFWSSCIMASVPACLRFGDTCERLRKDPARRDAHQRMCRNFIISPVPDELARACELACDKGSVDLCLRGAGLVYAEPSRARKLLEKACKLGDRDTCAKLLSHP